MSSEIPQTRLRRDLVTLEGTPERKRYFYCLKLLGILPPPPNTPFQKWVFRSPPSLEQGNQSWTDDKALLTPKSLHDVLIASHSTSCEHMNVYFTFYHRHLTILLEIFLNFAHQVLKGGFTKLRAVYPSPQFDWLHGNQRPTLTQKSNQQLWQDVFNVYKTFTNLPEYISDHYWNPSNYLVKGHMTIPEELEAKTFSGDQIDQLFLRINKAYPWQIHVPHKWYNKPEQYNQSDISRLIKINGHQISENEQKFINGNLDPRVRPNSQVYKQVLESGSIRTSFLNDHFLNFRRKVQPDRQGRLFDSKKNNFILNNITKDESLSSYGAAEKNVSYITRAQQKHYNLPNDMLQLSNETVLNYNFCFPHFQYAYPLFNYDLSNFIESPEFRSAQNSHNNMHNQFGYILDDDNFSVTSLIFYPYHSWIDFQYQIKARWATSIPSDIDYFVNILNDQFAPIPGSTKYKLQDVFGNINGTMVEMSDWKLSGSDNVPADSYGIYPVLEWVHPKLLSDETQEAIFSPSFTTRDYVLTYNAQTNTNNIRTSFYFDQIYKSPHYKESIGNRYWFFDNIDTFPHNYNYEFVDEPNGPKKLLSAKADQIPKYLSDMKGQVQSWNAGKKKALKFAQQVSFRNLALQKNVKVLNDDEIRQESLGVKKLFDSGLELFISYPSSTPNGHNRIVLKLKNVIHHLHKQLGERELHDLERYISSGLEVNNVLIFGKGHTSSACHKCEEHKAIFLEVDNDFRLRAPRIWQILHSKATNQVYYDSNNPGLKLASIYDHVYLGDSPNPNFIDYRLVSGAQEILIDVQTNILTKQAKFLRLDAQSFSVRTNKIKIIPSKKHETFNTNFDFYKLFDVDQSSNRVYFDRYVYKVLRGWVAVGATRIKFSVEIPSFQRLLRLILQINRDENGKLHVRLIDRDYQIKRAYYEGFTQLN